MYGKIYFASGQNLKIEGFEVEFSLQVFCFNFALYVIDQRLVMNAMLGSMLVCKMKYERMQM